MKSWKYAIVPILFVLGGMGWLLKVVKQLIREEPVNGAAIGGLKVVTDFGWFAARPSGTENVYKVYAESLRGEDHLGRLIEEAQALVAATIGGG